MDYDAHYNNLMAKARRRVQVEDYSEKHHVIPKCMGGDNSLENIVILTAREHFIAHWLLTKKFPREWKLYFALFQMTKSNGQHRRVVTSRQFEIARRSISEGAKLRYQMGLHPRKTIEGRKILSEKMKGDKNPMRRFPEKNWTAKPVKVIFDDGTERSYAYERLAYEDLGIPRSTWIYNRRMNKLFSKRKDIVGIE